VARTVKAWIGKTDDSRAPPRVRQRVFDRDKGICHFCKLIIKAPPETWQADHVIAIINGGANCESNLAPIHSHCHVEKTGLDLADKKKVASVRQKHLNIAPAVAKIQSAPFAISPKTAKRQANALAKLPVPAPRQLFAKENAQ
jgi:5-methylcytosine-specific restriction protein A